MIVVKKNLQSNPNTPWVVEVITTEQDGSPGHLVTGRYPKKEIATRAALKLQDIHEHMTVYIYA